MIEPNPSSPMRSLLRKALFCVAVGSGITGSVVAQSYTTARLADGFDIPVGKPNGDGYYVYRGFSPNGHLGEDWNGNGGGDSDEGDPVYSTANGVVVFSEDYMRGWGNVIIIRHAYREKNGQIAFVDSLYGHLKVRSVRVGQQVARGQLVGTIGTGPRGMYAAHLHFEIRKDLRVGMRRDLYPKTYTTYHSPRVFIQNYRRLRHEDRIVRIPINTFLKSNPNLLTTAPVSVEDITERSAAVRPVVPEEIETVIEAETSAEASSPEKTKSIFEKLFQKLSE